MTPRELKRAMRERRSALKKLLPKLKAEARAKVDAMPAVRDERQRRRLRRAAMSAGLLLLLLFVHCECGEGQLPEPAAPDAGTATDAGKPVPPAVKKASLQGKVQQQPRPDFGSTEPASPPWLDEFRMQVAARSPRLAECFTGVERPGALRWATSVNPHGGSVSDHELEPVGVGTDLSKDQRACILGVLSSPSYRLTLPGAQGLPNRVGLVIEF